MNELQVSKEFLAQEQLGQTMPKSKKRGGPYPTQAKKLRRDEVFKLHFDYGYSARKIDDMTKTNRNTINSDISFWYSQLQKEEHRLSTDDLINKILYRFETKRVRLMEKLDKATVLSDSILLEKMIYEIDNKIIQIVMKIQTANQLGYDRTMSMFNGWLEEHGYKERYILWGKTLQVTADTSNKIQHILDAIIQQYYVIIMVVPYMKPYLDNHEKTNIVSDYDVTKNIGNDNKRNNVMVLYLDKPYCVSKGLDKTTIDTK